MDYRWSGRATHVCRISYNHVHEGDGSAKREFSGRGPRKHDVTNLKTVLISSSSSRLQSTCSSLSRCSVIIFLTRVSHPKSLIMRRTPITVHLSAIYAVKHTVSAYFLSLTEPEHLSTRNVRLSRSVIIQSQTYSVHFLLLYTCIKSGNFRGHGHKC